MNKTKEKIEKPKMPPVLFGIISSKEYVEKCLVKRGGDADKATTIEKCDALIKDFEFIAFKQKKENKKEYLKKAEKFWVIKK